MHQWTILNRVRVICLANLGPSMIKGVRAFGFTTFTSEALVPAKSITCITWAAQQPPLFSIRKRDIYFTCGKHVWEYFFFHKKCN